MPAKSHAAKHGGGGARQGARRGRGGRARAAAPAARAAAPPASVLGLQRALGNSHVGALMNAGLPIQRCAACGGSCGGGHKQRKTAPGAPGKDKKPIQRVAAPGAPDKDKKPVQRVAAPGAPDKDKKPVQRVAAPGAPDKDKKPVQRVAAPGAPDKDKKPIQRAATGAAPATAAAPAAASSASPLPTSTRAAMEHGIGHDFGAVRVHTDAGAARQARDLNALAFTTGSNIYFAPGQFQPGSAAGHKLLAHELTHVVQQRAGRMPSGGIDTPGDRFEQEADRVANAVTRGGSARVDQPGRPPAIQRAGGPGPAGVQTSQGCAPANMLPIADAFEVPAEKGNTIPGGGSVLSRYKSMGPLSVRTTDRGDSTAQLRRNWKARIKAQHGIDLPTAADWFPATIRGTAGSPVPCSVDHIVESILWGGREGQSEGASNLMLMGGSRNSAAGGVAGGQVTRAREASAGTGRCIYFTKVVAQSPLPPDECMLIERNFPAWWQEQLRTDPNLAGLAPGTTPAAPSFILHFGHTDVPLDLRPKSGLTVTSTKVSGPFEMLIRGQRKNLTVRPGLQLKTIELKRTAPTTWTGGKIDGVLLSELVRPFKASPTTPAQLDVDAAGVVSRPKGAKMKTNFNGLSEAEFDFRMVNGNLEGDAELRPSLPILNRSIIRLSVREGKMSARAQVPVGQLSLPVPGLTLGGDGLTLGFEQGALFASGQVTLQYGTVARGELRVDASTRGGLTASGQIDLTIPGLDQARGRVAMDNRGQVSGSITLGADKLRIPGVRSANLAITIQNGALSGEGTLQLAIPGVRQARLNFGIDPQGNFGITGTATLAIPGVRDATLTLAYRDGDLSGEANVGLDVPGLEGPGAQFQLRYARGALTGTGSFSYRKGRLSGSVNVALSERHRLSGGGELAYEIAPGLQAFANLQIDENGRTRIQGGLRVPETIELFERKQLEKDLFRTPTIEIPIFAIPLGTRSLGLVATIDARVIGRVSIGPGQLRRVRLVADFDPSNESGAFGFQAAAELFVPANAELAVAVSGGLGLSLAIARAIGGIEAEGAAGVQANFIASADLRYQAGQFSVGGMAELSAQPRLAFRLNAFVRVEADLFVTTIEIYSRRWQLAAIEAGSGLKVGVRLPFKYVFGQPFSLGLDQVEFIRPNLDSRALMKELLPK